MLHRLVWEGLCSLEIPQDWSVREEEGVISIFNPQGVGALQISFAARERTGAVSATEPMELASEWTRARGIADVGLKRLMHFGMHAVEFETIERSDEDLTFWQVWAIVGERRAAFVTYVCDAADALVEKSERERIMASFSFQ